MRTLRVIAVEHVNASTDCNEPAIACVFRQGQLWIYDSFQQLYRQREYFDDFQSLAYLTAKGSYQWTDFPIRQGQTISMDIYDHILVDEQIVEDVAPFANDTPAISQKSILLFGKLLEKLNQDDETTVADIKQSLADGSLGRELCEIVKASPLKVLCAADKELIVRTRLEGYDFVMKKIKGLASSADPLKKEQIIYFFTRLFKLEYENYLPKDVFC